MLFAGLLLKAFNKAKRIHVVYAFFACIFFTFISNKSYCQITPVNNKEPKRFAISYIRPTVFDNPVLLKGLKLNDFQDNRCIQLITGARFGMAED